MSGSRVESKDQKGVVALPPNDDERLATILDTPVTIEKNLSSVPYSKLIKRLNDQDDKKLISNYYQSLIAKLPYNVRPYLSKWDLSPDTLVKLGNAFKTPISIRQLVNAQDDAKVRPLRIMRALLNEKNAKLGPTRIFNEYPTLVPMNVLNVLFQRAQNIVDKVKDVKLQVRNLLDNKIKNVTLADMLAPMSDYDPKVVRNEFQKVVKSDRDELNVCIIRLACLQLLDRSSRIKQSVVQTFGMKKNLSEGEMIDVISSFVENIHGSITQKFADNKKLDEDLYAPIQNYDMKYIRNLVKIILKQPNSWENLNGDIGWKLRLQIWWNIHASNLTKGLIIFSLAALTVGAILSGVGLVAGVGWVAATLGLEIFATASAIHWGFVGLSSAVAGGLALMTSKVIGVFGSAPKQQLAVEKKILPENELKQLIEQAVPKADALDCKHEQQQLIQHTAKKVKFALQANKPNQAGILFGGKSGLKVKSPQKMSQAGLLFTATPPKKIEAPKLEKPVKSILKKRIGV